MKASTITLERDHMLSPDDGDALFHYPGAGTVRLFLPRWNDTLVPVPIGCEVEVVASGSGSVLVKACQGVQILPPPGARPGEYVANEVSVRAGSGRLRHVAKEQWLAIGCTPIVAP